MSLPLQGCEMRDFIPSKTNIQELETVNDVEDQAWEETMSDERFEAQPYSREEI